MIVRGWRCVICGYEVLDNLPAPRPFARLATHFRRHPWATWRSSVEPFELDTDTGQTVAPWSGTTRVAPVDKR